MIDVSACSCGPRYASCFARGKDCCMQVVWMVSVRNISFMCGAFVETFMLYVLVAAPCTLYLPFVWWHFCTTDLTVALTSRPGCFKLHCSREGERPCRGRLLSQCCLVVMHSVTSEERHGPERADGLLRGSLQVCAQVAKVQTCSCNVCDSAIGSSSIP